MDQRAHGRGREHRRTANTPMSLPAALNSNLDRNRAAETGPRPQTLPGRRRPMKRVRA
jgi:hypothetical protein